MPFWRGGSGFPCLKTPATSAHHNLHTPRVPAGIPRIQTFARCEARLVATGFLWMGLLVPGKKYYTNINWKTWLGTKGRSKNKGWNIFVANVRFRIWHDFWCRCSWFVAKAKKCNIMQYHPLNWENAIRPKNFLMIWAMDDRLPLIRITTPTKRNGSLSFFIPHAILKILNPGQGASRKTLRFVTTWWSNIFTPSPTLT